MRRKDVTPEFIKRAFAISLFEIMQEKKFEDITITEICLKAGFGRTSYYRYYDNDREKLLLYLGHVEWAKYKDQYPDEAAQDGLAFLNCMYHYKNYFLTLHRQGLDSTIVKVMFNEFGGVKGEMSESSYAKAFVAGGTFGIAYEWILGGCEETPRQIKAKLDRGLRKEIQDAEVLNAINHRF
jgi:hypothetical protein